ncbi:MAG: hypothetical protein KGL63_09905 [Betaproteobacteria bacterium]|uniref:hypothetical protein n=1 Tax=Acidiphilium multivorum TaxID=62140 RepID=UPI001F4BE9D4|nr:hypothetical protein [Acidiphilium multivorum]MDE2343684.1 hypothetical protein [Betaproteobacteria bacterium]UNC16216.1 hypothetical protein FE249_18345 [Acidiphilium multivorum]
MDPKELAAAMKEILDRHVEALRPEVADYDGGRYVVFRRGEGGWLSVGIRDAALHMAAYADAPWLAPAPARSQEISRMLLDEPCLLAKEAARGFISEVARSLGTAIATRLPADRVIRQMQAVITASMTDMLVGFHARPGEADKPIDLEVLRIIGMAGGVNDAIAYRYYTEDTPHREWRRQAMEVWPLYSVLIARVGLLAKTVDTGASLAEALSDISGVNAKLLARLRGVSLDTGVLDPVAFCREIATLPPDFIPKADTVKLQALADLIDMAVPLTMAYGVTLASLFKDSKGDWTGFSAKVVAALSDGRMPADISEEDGYRLLALGKKLEAVAKGQGAETAIAVAPAAIQEENIQANPVSCLQWLSLKIDPNRTARATLASGLHDIVAMVESAKNQLVLPVAARVSRRDRINTIPDAADAAGLVLATSMTVNDRNLISIAETLHRYNVHAEAERSKLIEAGTPNLEIIIRDGDDIRKRLGLDVPAKQVTWPAWMEPVQAPNGAWIVDLNSDRLLYYEGANKRDPFGAFGLNHCCASMNGYNVNRCLGGTHILSVRMPIAGRYSRLGTACVRGFDPDKGDQQDLETVEYRYFSNQVPPPEGQEALAWFYAQAAAGRLRFNAEALRGFTHEQVTDRYGAFDDNQPPAAAVAAPARASLRDRVHHICGYDWMKDDEVEGIMQVWRQCLGKKWRSLSLDGLSQLPEIRQIGRVINPAVDARNRAVSSMLRLTL